MAIKDLLTLFMYVNPTTSNVEKMVLYSPFGLTERVDSDWKPVTRDESGIDDLSEDKVYILDWDTDYLRLDEEEDGKEHAAVELYDSGTLTEEDCKKYGKLHIDPNDMSNPELDKLIGQ